MDTQTESYYAKHAQALLHQYAAAGDVNARHFGFAFPQHIAEPYRVLDVGAGTGRDLLILLEQGYDAFGIEPVDAMRNAALSQSMSLHGRLLSGNLQVPLPAPLAGKRFDGVLCSAVLQHIEKSQLVASCLKFKDLLREKGRLFLSTPKPIASDAPNDTDQRDENGRIFNRWHPDFLVLLFERLNFRLVDRWESQDSLGRAERSWNNFVFSLEGTEQKGGLERIEEIIFRDKKTSTYKIALIRALCEIAISGSRDIQFCDNGVHVPLRRISELWLHYYWPLLVGRESNILPQNTQIQIAFQAVLNELARATNQRDLRMIERNTAGPNVSEIRERALCKIGETIIKQPVHYAGLLSEAGSPFAKGKLGKIDTVIVHPEVWRELALFGHWLKDSLVLEWSRWSANLAKKRNLDSNMVAQEVIRLLSQTDTQARDTSIARELFSGHSVSLPCTWSGRMLRTFDVDHILPFAHFANNDLWNLVPAAPTVNNEKRDRAPSTVLLESSRTRLEEVWSFERSGSQSLFEADVCRFTGLTSLFAVRGDWKQTLFDALWESVALWESGGKERVWNWEKAG